MAIGDEILDDGTVRSLFAVFVSETAVKTLEEEPALRLSPEDLGSQKGEWQPYAILTHRV